MFLWADVLASKDGGAHINTQIYILQVSEPKHIDHMLFCRVESRFMCISEDRCFKSSIYLPAATRKTEIIHIDSM